MGAQHDATAGRVALAGGPAALNADAERRAVRVEAEDAKAPIEARCVIDIHPATVARRKGFTGPTRAMAPA